MLAALRDSPVLLFDTVSLERAGHLSLISGRGSVAPLDGLGIVLPEHDLNAFCSVVIRAVPLSLNLALKGREEAQMVDIEVW